jgi:hypothetical protein
MRYIAFLAGFAGLAACTETAPTGEPPLTGDTPEVGQADTGASGPSAGPLRIGGGYRAPDDACRRTGVTDLTAPFASSENDLVACPVDFEGRPAFIQGTKAREVTRTADWVVYSVPLFGEAPVAQIPVAPPITGG